MDIMAKTNVLAVVTALFVASFLGASTLPGSMAFAGEEAFVRIERPSEGRVKMVVRASGVGIEPAGHSGAQARLMARRAAVVDGYRKLAVMRGRVWGSFSGKAYHESVDDFIKGAVVIETRYYIGGRVEVDMEAPVNASAIGGASGPERIRETLSGSGIDVVEVEPERLRITREEWEELFKKRQTAPEEPKENENRAD